MFCSKCGNANGEGEKFCRKCGSDLPEMALAQTRETGLQTPDSRDPDTLTGNGIGSVIVGDGFFMVAVILAATQSPVSSLLWLFLLIPAFFFFGRGFTDVFQARQLRRRRKEVELGIGHRPEKLPAGRLSALGTFEKVISGELTPVPSVTERTTRNLK
ncbi:MAG TPA: zinc-ribbon domain-containing protein [Pyrinomonadaceae bacterium]|nr:zinc-ribbon domain-containing protein [Pyrinomonadaceae bacterium]